MQTEHRGLSIQRTGREIPVSTTECTGRWLRQSVLYRVTKKVCYAEAYAEFMEYLDEKVLDHVNGSWFHQLDRNNQPIGTVWPGKSDLYHALQSVLIPYSRVDLSIACAVRER